GGTGAWRRPGHGFESRPPEKHLMTLVALDLNATRIRAACGASAAEARPQALDGKQPELPMALSLEARHPALGRAGTALCRRSPHLACLCFLPYLGQRREW